MMKNDLYNHIVRILIVAVLFMNCISTFAQTPDWQWANTAIGTHFEQGSNVAIDVAGNVYVTGFFTSTILTFGNYLLTNSDSTGNESEIFIVKYNSSGNVLWAKSAGGKGSDDSQSIAVDALGNFYITGEFYSDTINFDSIYLVKDSISYNDIFLAKYDSSGNLIWAKRAGGTGSDESFYIKPDGFGNVYITGFFNSSIINFDTITAISKGGYVVYIAKYNTSHLEMLFGLKRQTIVALDFLTVSMLMQMGILT